MSIPLTSLPEKYRLQVIGAIRPKPPAKMPAKAITLPVAGLSGLPPHVAEYRFHPVRKWRFDYAWPDRKIALEIDGGLFVNGGHSRGKAREGDYEKDANALILGWRVLRVSTGQMKSGFALLWLKQIMGL